MEKTGFRKWDEGTHTVFFIIICLILLSGCSNKKIDYEIDGSEGTGIKLSGDSSVEQFQDIPRWNESITVEKSDGQTVPILINASITLPEVEEMAVVEIRQIEFDASDKEQFLKSVFGDSQIFYTDAVDFTGMSEDYALITDYEADYYKGNMDGGTYCLAFDTNNIFKELESESLERLNELEFYLLDRNDMYFYGGGNTIYLYAADESIRPQGIASGAVYRQVFPDIRNPFSQISDGEKNASNMCTLTEEEARVRVESFLDQIGFPDVVYMDCKDAYWQEYELNDNVYERENVLTVKDGYIFTYKQEWESFLSDKKIQVTKINISINDAGILRLLIVNPFDMISITEKVDLLSFESIKEIMKNELAEHADDYYYWLPTDEDVTQNYHTVELRYYCMEDPSHRKKFSYIPVWELSHFESDIANVVVNAIDGSILGAMDEGAHLEEEDEYP